MQSANRTLPQAAHAYLAAGLCVLPARRAEKRPAIGRWKQYRHRLPTAAELTAWLASGSDGLCILCGKVSGNAEMIDFDAGGELFEAWKRRIPPELLAKLVIERTQHNGWHVYYLCKADVCGNMKLAQRRDGDRVVTLIETRGEGGLSVCAPTPGYEVVQGDLAKLPILTVAERDLLLQAAWDLNEYVPPVIDGPRAPAATIARSGRPGDDFNGRGDVRALLESHGWVRETVASDGNEHWRRPGKPAGTSATLKDGVFFVFSSNASPFEPGQPYSAFAVYAHLEHGGDFEQAARALRAEGYGGDPLVGTSSGVILSGIVGGAGDEPVERPPEVPDPGPLPDDMLRVPGFVSEVMDYCLTISPYPNQVMAFSGALALQAFLAGRKVRDPGDNRTNLYLLGLAHSAAGKDWPRKVNKRIVHTVGLADCLGDGFASGEGIQDALYRTPNMLFQTDEIDGMLQSINKAKDARHEAIMGTLLTMYSSANSVFPMRRKAGKESPGVIDQPNLVIFGTAIPNHYYEALSERMLTNGFFARTITLEAGPRAPGQEPRIGELPPRVVATAQCWVDYRPGPGNLTDQHPVPAIIEHSDDAKRLLIETRLEAESEYAKAEARSDPVGTTVWGRVSEQVRKLALLYAVSERHRSSCIDVAAVEWASRFVMHQTRRMLFMASQHVAEGEFDALIKRAIGILRQWHDKHGPTALMPAWELRRRLKQRPGDFKDIVLELAERQIAKHDIDHGTTKPKSGYRLL